MTLTPASRGYPIKLVRDNTAAIVNPSEEPGDLFYAPLPDPDLRAPWLRRKLNEEVGEYLEARTIDELQNVLGVVEGLAQIHGTSLASLMDRLRQDPRGGFLRGVIMYGLHPEYDK